MCSIQINISGLNQLLWYYADLEKKKCLDDMYSRRDTLEGLMHGRRSNKVNNVTAGKQMGVIIWMRVGGNNYDPTCFSDLGAGDGVYRNVHLNHKQNNALL